MTTELPNTVDYEAVYHPTFSEIMVIRGSHRDRTTEWAFRVVDADLNNGTVRLTGHIVGARFADHLDARLENQRASINRLMTRLQEVEDEVRSLRKEMDRKGES